MRLHRTIGATAALAATLATLAFSPSAVSAATSSTPTRVDPKILRAITTGFVSPWDAHARGLHPGEASIVVELVGRADAKSIAALEKAGAKPTYVGGAPLSFDRFVPASVDVAALRALSALSIVHRISLGPAAGPMALDHSAQIIGLEGARGANRPADEYTGKGIVIADADTDVDVFHPKMFQGDAGWFDWIDVDGNGTFDADKDAIDLDGDGKASSAETAHVLISQTLDFGGDPVNARAVGFDPAIDWLFLDTDGNGKRDFGPGKGFDDTTPAFGEPLFVPDDVNKNGKLDVEERVVRLGSSKLRDVYVDLITPYVTKRFTHVFSRGKDLSQLKPAYTDSAIYGYADSLHATGVMSILVGDVPLVGRRWVGMAPDADVVLAWSIDNNLSHVTWALGRKPDVMFHEVAPWTGQPLDGSDDYSKMIDTSVTTDHVTHTCPTGDIGGSGKHAHVVVPAGGSKTLPFTAPASSRPYSYVDVSLNVRGVPISATGAPPTIDAQIVEPNGTKHAIGISADTTSTGATIYPASSTTDRGTYFVDVVLYTTDTKAAPIPTGGWTIVVTGDATKDATVDAYVSDDLSGFGRGWAWEPPVVIEASTLAYPSTADHCVAIGAEPAHAHTEGSWFDGDEPIDSVRDYSPRGPRIDGMIKPDVLAPDNPWSAAPNVPEYPGGSTPPPGSVWPFGGTSGSVPHAAGVTALLAQIGVRGDAAGDLLRKTARTDGITEPLPNADWGYGRMNAAAAMGGTFQGARPSIALTITPSTPHVGDTISVTPTPNASDGDAVAIEGRWDDGYDGTWDSAYAPLATRTIDAKTAGIVRIKLRARNALGRVSEAVARIVVTDAPPVEPPPDDAGDASTSNGADGGSSSHGCGCSVPRDDVALGGAGACLALLALVVARRRLRSDDA